MPTVADLQDRVEEYFAARDPHLRIWPAPREFVQQPAESEYSRVTDPERWRVLGARADAWLAALVDGGLASVVPTAPDAVAWAAAPGPEMTSAVRVLPAAPGALPLVVARSRLGGVPDTGVTLGLGDPAVPAGIFPDCGCDACDTGAQQDLDSLDQLLASIVTGAYRQLTRGTREITVTGDGWWASGIRSVARAEAIIAHPPRRWRELSGTCWLV